MATTEYSLTWNSFKNNITTGLSTFQQNEEFVDMTLAADGYLVKVHRMVLSLASPYLKELLSSAPCSHPILFLNNVSHKALSSILQYVYSGEVLVCKENLAEFLEAGKALHIKGLEILDATNKQPKTNEKTSYSLDNKEKIYLPKYCTKPQNPKTFTQEEENTIEHIEIGNESYSNENHFDNDGGQSKEQNSDYCNYASDACVEDDHLEDGHLRDDDVLMQDSAKNKLSIVSKDESTTPTLQYTLSNQGNLQLILNRYLYFIRYNYKNSNPPHRLWRCVEYPRNRCPASVTTRDDMVVKRVAAHCHGFHDKKIVRKLQSCTIFTTIKDAEREGSTLKINQKSSKSDESV